jgi:hydroxymethylpyrimidine pyrophosphatase-like HAD family hydrolase
MDPRIIAIDMDGTLLGSNGRVSPRNLDALRLATNAGIEVVIATGRRHGYAMRILGDLRLPSRNAVVSSNGTVIRTIGAELLHRTHLSLSAARWLTHHVADFRDTLIMTFDRIDPDGRDSRGALVLEKEDPAQLDGLHALIGAWMRSNEPYIQRVESLEARLEDATEDDAPIQMMLCGGLDRMAAAEARLLSDPRVTAVGAFDSPHAEITLHRTAYPEKNLSLVDILPAGCSKASALEHLAALRGIDTREILAIGDNWNDLPMLRLAGQAALMSNAPADLHHLASTHGWTVAPSNDEDGVAIVIEAALEASLALSCS